MKKVGHYHALHWEQSAFVRSHLDCGDIIYYQPNNATLSDKIECM